MNSVLGLRRNIVVLSLAIFYVGLGEELWARFFPMYMEVLGACAPMRHKDGRLTRLLAEEPVWEPQRDAGEDDAQG
jgi:hypothetical protein